MHPEPQEFQNHESFDRELTLFFTELRVALPGVQILFAFMLSVPFYAKFEQATAVQRCAYFIGFAFCAAASALLIAPSVYHRIHWHLHVQDRRRIMLEFNRLAIAGGICLAVAMTSTIFLITDVLFGSVAALPIALVAAAAFSWLWFGFPVARRKNERRSPHEKARHLKD